jgi:hypothetical protein
MSLQNQRSTGARAGIIPAPVPAAAGDELGRPDQGLSLAQLERIFPVGRRIQGRCNFVVHDKEKTPIMEVRHEDRNTG